MMPLWMQLIMGYNMPSHQHGRRNLTKSVKYDIHLKCEFMQIIGLYTSVHIVVVPLYSRPKQGPSE